MNYERPELLDRLAAEYALGTLRGRARRRFERLCVASAAVRSAVYRWEDHWSAMSRTLPQVQPSAQVWPAVSRRLFGDAGAAPPRQHRQTGVGSLPATPAPRAAPAAACDS